MEKEHKISEDTPELITADESYDPPPYSSAVTPFGLEQLSVLERVDVLQKDVVTEHGEVVFTLKRELAGKGMNRNFLFDLYDKVGKLAIRLRPVSTFIKPRLEVLVEGELVAMLRMRSFFMFFTCSPVYLITDANDRKVMKIKTPSLFQREFILRLKDLKGQRLGEITKKWNGPAEEMFADSNQFQISFPKDLEVPYKATVIGICVLFAQSASLQHYSSD